MCINCNLIAPVKHYICDLLGIEHNTYGFPASIAGDLETLIVEIYLELDINNPDKKFKKTPLTEWLDKNFHLANYLYKGIREEKKYKNYNSLGPTDTTIINFVYKGYFLYECKDLPKEFFDGLRIPVDVLLNDKTHIKWFQKVRYFQIRQIPRKVLNSWNDTQEDIIARCNRYGIELMEEPFTDEEPTKEDSLKII